MGCREKYCENESKNDSSSERVRDWSAVSRVRYTSEARTNKIG